MTISANSNPEEAPQPPKNVEPFFPGKAEANELNEGYQALQADFANFATESVPKAVQLGEKLLKIKKALGWGPFGKWVEDNLDFDGRTARRYMARARAKRTGMSDLDACVGLFDPLPPNGNGSDDSKSKRPLSKLFSAAAAKVLNQPIEDTSAEDKITILRDFERLEPIALQFHDQPSVFSLTWQKKLLEPPARWARKDVALFKAEVARAQAIRAALEDDALFDANTSTSPVVVIGEAAAEGDAP